jgi:hypothetical protein
MGFHDSYTSVYVTHMRRRANSDGRLKKVMMMMCRVRRKRG